MTETYLGPNMSQIMWIFRRVGLSTCSRQQRALSIQYLYCTFTVYLILG